jgi:hypothetical protein
MEKWHFLATCFFVSRLPGFYTPCIHNYPSHPCFLLVKIANLGIAEILRLAARTKDTQARSGFMIDVCMCVVTIWGNIYIHMYCIYSMGIIYII